MKPDFFIVGAAKCGTSSLANYLSQHPDVGFSLHKEPNYFVFKDRDLSAFPGPAPGPILEKQLYSGSITTEAGYQRMFAGVAGRKMLGEGSVRYLYDARAAEKIAKANRAAKIIIMLRDPVDRLWSHYIMMKSRYHLEPASLEKALLLEPARIAAGWDYDWHYTAVSRYHDQIVRYLEHFGPEQVRVYLFEDFIRDPRELLEDIYRFLGIASGFQPNMSQREMAGYWLRSFWIDKLLFFPNRVQNLISRTLSQSQVESLHRMINRLNRLPPPRLSPRRRERLRALFTADNRRLAALLGRSLAW